MTEEAKGAGDPAEPRDEEEFAKLPAPASRGPLVGVAVILVGLLLLVRLADDTRFALASREPRDLGDARKIDAAALADNQHVAIAGLPDRRNALQLDRKGDRYRRSFFRLLGTGSRVLVRYDETVTRHQFEDRFVGRLRRFDEVPWADDIRRYYADKIEATRLLDLAKLRERLAAGAAPLVDRAGDKVEIAASEDVRFEIDFPEDLRVSLPTKQFPVEEDARHELERLGVPVGPSTTLRDNFLFVVRIGTEQRNAFIAKLEERGFPFALRRERFIAKLGELSIEGDALSLPSRKDQPAEYDARGSAMVARATQARTAIPWARIANAQVAAPVKIPADAWLLVENEHPGDFTWVLALDAVLVLFIAFNAWMLVRSRRRPAAVTMPPT